VYIDDYYDGGEETDDIATSDAVKAFNFGPHGNWTILCKIRSFFW
jgi:hypothetical protein